MSPSFRLCMVVLILIQLSFTNETFCQDKFDVVIRGGRVVDGSGAPWYVADLAIDDGRIVHVGNVPAEEASVVIEARGKVVAPGFIDMMGQAATPMLRDPQAAINLLTQGITTINAGEGVSAAPLSDAAGQRAGWTSMAEYFQLLDSKGLPLNVVQTIGHTQVREIVLGETNRHPSADDLTQMQSLVREAMEAGAIGVSSALIYPPAVYADVAELAALAKMAGEYGGKYFTHMRNEGDALLEAIDEALEIGRAGQVPVHIFHLKTAGQQNWGKMGLAIARIKAARASGQQVTADVYPYLNNGLGVEAFIHPQHFTEGNERLLAKLDNPEVRQAIRQQMETTTGWENWFQHVSQDWNRVVVGRSGSQRYAGLDGRSIAEIAKLKNEDPWETFFELVRARAFVLPQTMSEANKILAMQQDFVSFCTDVGPAGNSGIASHPRAFGAFPRLLSHYVRDLGALSLERAVAQASASAANNVFAYDRGRIAVGLAADIIVFDAKSIVDRATFTNPRELSEGIELVMVNGQIVLKDGRLTEARPGRVLRGPGFQKKTAPSAVASSDKSPGFEHFDQALTEWMREHRVPGLSLAISRAGKLVHAKGYGYADVRTREPVQPDSLFRIASISKPITAVAILQLVEQGKLSLSDKVLDLLDLDSVIAPLGDKFDQRFREITIAQLLEHRGGWDRDQSFDAMFQSVRFAKQLGMPPPAGPMTVIEAMLGQRLDFDPGQRYAYSNFGYCLLGRVIEKLTGLPYEQAVQQNVLSPMGISSMRIGGTRLDKRAPREVRYYHASPGESVFQSDLGQEVPSPYGAWYLEAMDSHGGWIATASDLANFAAAFDNQQHCKLLKPESIQRMWEPPQGLPVTDKSGRDSKSYYSLGWFNRETDDQRFNRWHTGSLPGTATIMMRRWDGWNLVALVNCRETASAEPLSRALDKALHRAADATSIKD